MKPSNEIMVAKLFGFGRLIGQQTNNASNFSESDHWQVGNLVVSQDRGMSQMVMSYWSGVSAILRVDKQVIIATGTQQDLEELYFTIFTV